jgi:hypothetical protein
LKGVAKYALPKMLSKHFSVTMKGGQQFNFDGNWINDHCEFAAMMKKETDKRNVRWEIVEDHCK